MSPLEPSSPNTAGPEQSKIFETQVKDLEAAFTNVIEVFGEEMNKSLKEIYRNTNKQWEEINKTVPDLKVEI